MMDVDDVAAVGVQKRTRQHLHMAGKHQKIAAVHQREHRRLMAAHLPLRSRPAGGHIVQRHAVPFQKPADIRVSLTLMVAAKRGAGRRVSSAVGDGAMQRAETRLMTHVRSTSSSPPSQRWRSSVRQWSNCDTRMPMRRRASTCGTRSKERVAPSCVANAWKSASICGAQRHQACARHASAHALRAFSRGHAAASYVNTVRL